MALATLAGTETGGSSVVWLFSSEGVLAPSRRDAGSVDNHRIAEERRGMSTSDSSADSEQAKFDEVMDTAERPRPDRREHAKADPRPDDDELERRTEIERSEVGLPEEDGT
jgi:hypothetical protein